MWSAGSGISSLPDARAAAREASEAALSGLGGPGSPAGAGRADAALVFAGPGHAAQASRLLEGAAEVLGTRCLVGGLAHGVIGAGQEDEGASGVSVLAVAGLEAASVWVPDLAGQEDVVGDELLARLGGAPRPEDLVVLVPDPRALRPERLLDAVHEAVGPAGVVGAGAADPLAEAPRVWCGREVESGALAALVLRGAAGLRVGVTQACRPATPLLTVTRASGPWVQEIDGRPALDVYREAARRPLADDLSRAAAFVLAALPRDSTAPLAPGGYLVRNVVGFDTDANAFAIPQGVKAGDPLLLVHREPETARDDLKALLAGLVDAKPGLALYLDCCARGAGFFGVAGLEAGYLGQAFPGVPLGGMFGSCEIGPIAGRPELLTYTGVLALLER